MEVRLLGPLQVATGGGVRHVRGTKMGAVLAILATRVNQVVPSETLIDAIWEDDPPPSVAATLQTHVYHLRRSFALESSLQTRTPGYCLELPRKDVDALRFEDAAREVLARPDADPAWTAERLGDALAWWRGEALVDFGAAAWARTARSHLAALRVDARERFIEARIRLGEHAAVLPELEMLLADNPYREALWAHYMVALYRADRQADALRAYTTLRTNLVEDLGIEPAPHIASLERAILEQDQELRTPPARVASPVAAPALDAAEQRRRSPRRRRAFLMVVAPLVVASAVGALVAARSHSAVPVSAPVGYEPRYRAAPCPPEIRSGDASAVCGRLTVPENRDRPHGRTIELGVFRYPARHARPVADPVVQVGSQFLLSEPPGDTALRSRGDSIYLAGRGFFGSTPRLTCPRISDVVVAALARRLRDPVNDEAFLLAAQQCRDEWRAQSVDLSAYSAWERAADVRDMAFALHLRRLNLLADGPATRDAYEVAVRYPDLVRSVTVFNVTPPEGNPWNGAIANAVGALDRYYGECGNEPACVRAYPDLRGQVDRVYASLQREPQVYTIHDPSDSTRSAVVLLDGDRVMQVLLRALDDPTALSLAPAAIADPASGQAAVDFAARSVLPPRDASWGALLSRACIDDAGSVGTAGLSVESEAAPEFAFVAEDPVLSACAVWGTPTARTRVAGPARAPTLILQGDLDPFTSREFAQEAARTFGDAVVVTLPRVGRVASISNPCVADLRSRFLAHPTTLVRGDCTRSIEPIPFAGM